jgi:hypothetical protein
VRRFTARVALALATLLGAPAYADAPPTEAPWVWAPEAASPRPVLVASLSDHEVELQRTCGRGEAGLATVASRLASRRLRGLPYLDADGLALAQRVAGEPHVWPRAWVVSGVALDHEATRQKLAAWGATFHDPGERRCGVAIAYGADGTEAIAVVAVDAAADLGPLPVRARVGAWLAIEAQLLVPATGARVVLTGPDGRPRTVVSQLDGDRVHARFAVDQPGAITVQVVGDLAGGPRPLLEAVVFADVAPWTELPDLTAPGESAAGDAPDPAAMHAMVAALRSAEHLAPLLPDARLDALATAHAERMRRLGVIGHDVGNGDPVQRIAAAGLRARACGENVAHAATVVLAHRSLYASPSHRANLLSTTFDRVGVGVVRDADGSVWVAEEFAAGLR